MLLPYCNSLEIKADSHVYSKTCSNISYWIITSKTSNQLFLTTLTTTSLTFTTYYLTNPKIE